MGTRMLAAYRGTLGWDDAQDRLRELHSLIRTYFSDRHYTHSHTVSRDPFRIFHTFRYNSSRILLTTAPDQKKPVQHDGTPPFPVYTRIRHEWEFACPDNEADLYIEDITKWYKEIGFEMEMK